MAGYTHKAVRGIGWALLFTILASIVAYLTRIILARKLPPAEYGLFYAVFTFVIFFLFFRDLGLGQALVKYVSEYKAKNDYNAIKTCIFSVFTIQLISSILFGIIFYFLADYLSVHYFKDPRAASMLKLLVLYMVFSMLFITIKQTFQGFQRMFLFSSVEFVKNTLVLLFIILFFYFGYTLFSPAYAYILACPLLLLIYYPFLRRHLSLRKYITIERWNITRKLVTFGLPILGASVGERIIGYIDTLLMTYFSTLTEVGIYNVVLPSALVFTFFGRAVSFVVFPISSELWARQDKERLKKGLFLLHRYSFLLILPLVLSVIYFALPLLDLFFGEGYVSGTVAFQILLAGVGLYVVGSINNNFLAGIGKPKSVAVIILAAAALNTVLNLIFIPRWGINGAAIATTASYALLLAHSTIIITRTFQFRFPWKEWCSLLIPLGAYYAVTAFVEKLLHLPILLEMVITIVAAGAVYVGMLYFGGIITPQELRRHLRQIRRKSA